MWTLIPGFSGLGTLLAGLLGMEARRSIQAGAWQVFISLVLFFIFGSFLGGLNLFGAYWPLLLVLLGLLILLRPLFKFNK
jgi:ribose/xylose/arabinose/galactoside ABC-type transport system permease subunit